MPKGYREIEVAKLVSKTKMYLVIIFKKAHVVRRMTTRIMIRCIFMCVPPVLQWTNLILMHKKIVGAQKTSKALLNCSALTKG